MNQSAFMESAFELEVPRVYRQAMLEHVIEKYDLDVMYQFVMSPANDTKLGYHNPGHCSRVALRAYELYQLERQYAEDCYDLPTLLMACLFHDFNHSGMRPDSVNIERAVAGMYAYTGHLPIPRRCLEEVESLIRVTEFPFKRKPDYLLEKIILDADMMESFEPFHRKVILHDLRIELEPMQGKITVQEAVERQKAFVDAITMHTDAGKRIWAATKPAMLRSMQAKATELELLGITE